MSQNTGPLHYSHIFMRWVWDRVIVNISQQRKHISQPVFIRAGHLKQLVLSLTASWTIYRWPQQTADIRGHFDRPPELGKVITRWETLTNKIGLSRRGDSIEREGDIHIYLSRVASRRFLENVCYFIRRNPHRVWSNKAFTVRKSDFQYPLAARH